MHLVAARGLLFSQVCVFTRSGQPQQHWSVCPAVVYHCCPFYLVKLYLHPHTSSGISSNTEFPH
jgi:hypothetical protein